MSKEGGTSFSPEQIVRLLIEPTGHTMMHRLHEAIKDNRELRRVGICGKPGVGKTLIAEGIASILLKEYPDLIDQMPLLLFDVLRRDFLDQCARQGVVVDSIPQLPKALQKYFADYLTYAFFGGTDLPPEKKTVYRFETVGIGKVDRGQTALKRMAKRNATSEQLQTLLLYVIGDPSVALQAKKERTAAEIAQNDYELLILLSEIGIHIRVPTEEDKKSTELLGKYRRRATPQQIDLIDKEVAPKIKKFYKTAFNPENKVAVETLKHLMQIPPGIRVETEEEWFNMLMEVMFAYDHLTKLGFSPNSFIVVINQFAGPIHH